MRTTDHATDTDSNSPTSQPRQEADSQKSIIVYTDGGCIGNPGPGGWAAILCFGTHEKELSGRSGKTTNNRMEMRAAIAALEAIKRPYHIELYTDSQYLRQGITQWVHAWQRNNWRTANKQPVKNRDLWQRLLAAVARHESAGGVEWRWTKGHAGDALNERADQLANTAARTATPADPTDLDDSPTSNQTPLQTPFL